MTVPDSRVLVSGAACLSDLADSPEALIEALAAGRQVEQTPVFPSERIQRQFGFSFMPRFAPMNNALRRFGHRTSSAMVEALLQVTRVALDDAGLSDWELIAPDTQVIWASPGHQPDLKGFIAHVHGNDKLDLLLNPGVRHLAAGSFRNDTLTAEYRRRLGLVRPVHTVYSACSSSLTALLLAYSLMRTGRLRRAVILGWQGVTLFDILFLSSINVLSRHDALPFAARTDGILPGFGIGALVLERPADVAARGGHGYYGVRAVRGGHSVSGSLRSPSMAVSFRALAHSMDQLFEQSGVRPEEIDVIYPHGNGIRASDQAEAMALHQRFGAGGPPVINYTYQLGYLLAASGIFDLIAACDAFRRQRLVPFVSPQPLDDSYPLNFLMGGAPRAHKVQRALKTNIGIDGSVLHCLLEDLGNE